MDQRLEIPNLDNLHEVIATAGVSQVLVDTHRYKELQAFLVVDEFVDVEGLVMNFELALNL